MINKIWKRLWLEWWEFCDIWYAFTGTRIQKPIELFFPHHCEWVFEQMTGLKGEKLKGDE